MAALELRPLRPLEYWYAASATSRRMTNVAITLHISSEQATQLTHANLVAAASLLWETDTIMRLALTQDDPPSWFEQERAEWEVLLPNHVEVIARQSDHSYVSLLEKLHDPHCSPPLDGLCWRIYVVVPAEATTNFEIVLLFHHALLDGAC